MKEKIKNLLLKKEDGSAGIYFVTMILFMLFMVITMYELTFEKTVHLKSKVDNGIILSALSANVVDLFQYATTGDVAYATSRQTAKDPDIYIDPSGTPYSGYMDVLSGNVNSGKIAMERFIRSLNDNLSFIDYSRELTLNDNTTLPIGDDDYVKSARIDSFILYNVVNGKIYKTERTTGTDFSVTELTGHSDPEVEKANNIETSCLYVKMTFTFYLVGGYEVTVPFDELVGISTT